MYRQYGELNQRINLLERLIEDLPEEGKEIYFDCVEQTDDHQLVELFPIRQQPWIGEIWLTVYRKTSLFRRFWNVFRRSKCSFLPDLAEEFLRIYNGRFHYPLGFRFHISYGKEKWLLILKNITVWNYPIHPYPQTRIIFIYKNLSFIAR